MIFKRFKLNVLSAEGLRQKELNAIVGGKRCTCSCYWNSGQGGSPDGTNTYANYGVGAISEHGCNQYIYDDEIGCLGWSGNVSANM